MLTFDSLKVFDNVIEFYNWPKHVNDDILDKLKDVNNFNASNYKYAVSCYKNWCENTFPAIMDSNKDDYKLAFAQQTYNILHTHAPNHRIHLALAKY